MDHHAGSGAVAGILLAAGASRRFGRPKQLLEVEGETLLRRSARIAREAGLDPVVAVLDGEQVEGLGAELVDIDVVSVRNSDPDRGMASSLKVGLSACPPDAAGVMVLVCDQPGLSVELIQHLLVAWRSGPATILRPRSQGRPGHPVLFDAEHLPALCALGPAQSGRIVIADNASAVGYIEVELQEIEDVDSPADWRSQQP